jgi:threonine/homoserine/homoserine lactone efflux protein
LPAIIEGILLGLVLATMIGPVFFALINLSINKGFIPSLFLAIGISLNDTLFIFLANWLSETIGISNRFYFWIGLCGGAILIVYGFSMLFKKPAISETSTDISFKENKSYFVKGFVLNGVNPFVWLYWIGIASFLESKGTYTLVDKTTFFAGTIATVFLTDLLKIKLASYLKRFISPLFLKRLNLALGIGIILFGIKLVYESFSKFNI